MRTETLYRCDVCESAHQYPADASACQESHTAQARQVASGKSETVCPNCGGINLKPTAFKPFCCETCAAMHEMKELEKEEILKEADAIRNPLDEQCGGAHYLEMAIQPAVFTTKNGIGHLAGDAIAYLCRYKTKNGAEDLRKAIHSIQLLLKLEYGE